MYMYVHEARWPTQNQKQLTYCLLPQEQPREAGVGVLLGLLFFLLLLLLKLVDLLLNLWLLKHELPLFETVLLCLRLKLQNATISYVCVLGLEVSYIFPSQFGLALLARSGGN